MRLESIVDIQRETFSSEIFINPADSKPRIKPEVRTEFLKTVEPYKKYGEVLFVQLIGSMLTKRYTDESDLDVTVVMSFDSEDNFEAAKKLSIKSADTILLKGTTHPINVYVRTDNPVEMWDDVYNITDDYWMKQTLIKYPDFEVFLKHFEDIVKSLDLTKAQLYRDVVDYNELTKIPSDEIAKLKLKIEAKLEEIDEQVKKLAYFYQIITTFRAIVFRKVYDPAVLKKVQSRNLLPANIIYKLLEKYHYTKFLKAINKTLKLAKGEIDEPEEVEMLMKHIESGIDEITTSAQAGPYFGKVWRIGPLRRKKRKKKRKEVSGE